jgi:hypothetical protein
MMKPTRSWTTGLGLKTLATLLLSTLLVSCGSSKKYDEFIPTRIVSAGDGMSYLGTSPTYVNTLTVTQTGANTNGAFDHWLKQFAYGYGLTTIGNSPTGTAQIVSLATTLLAPGLHTTPRLTPSPKPSDFSGYLQIKAQIDTAIASGGLRPDDLLVLSVGVGDILELSENYLSTTDTEAVLVAEAKLRGQRYMDYANTLYQNGTFKRIILVNPINLRSSPYAVNGETIRAGISGAGGLIDQMTEQFVYGLKSSASTYPREAGVWLFDATNLVLNVNLAFANVNVTDPFCSTAPTVLETCTTVDTTNLASLNTNVSNYYSANSAFPTYVFAGSIMPTPFVHQYMGATLYNRMRSAIGF